MAVFAGLLWALYRLRLRRVSRQFVRVLDARVAERTRIARDLHDVPGSFNALLLRLEAASVVFQTRPAEAKQTLDSTIAQTARALNEGWKAVQGLRSSVAEPNNLAEAIGRLQARSGGARPQKRSKQQQVWVRQPAQRMIKF